MRRSIIFVLVLLAAAMAYQVSAEANLLSDPGFENGGTAIDIKDGPWTWSGGSSGGAFYSSDVAQAGEKSAKVVMWGGNNTDYAYFVEEFSGIDTSKTYTASANFLNNSADMLNQDATTVIQVKWFNSLGSLITMDESSPFDSSYSLDTWHKISMTSTAPAMATKAAVVLAAFSNSAYTPNSTVYVDNMEFDAVPEPSSIALLAGGLVGLLGISRKK